MIIKRGIGHWESNLGAKQIVENKQWHWDAVGGRRWVWMPRVWGCRGGGLQSERWGSSGQGVLPTVCALALTFLLEWKPEHCRHNLTHSASPIAKPGWACSELPRHLLWAVSTRFPVPAAMATLGMESSTEIRVRQEVVSAAQTGLEQSQASNQMC